MRPDIPEILAKASETLSAEVAPALEGQYKGGHAAMIGLIGGMAAAAFENAVDIRLKEIAAMRSIFQEAESVVTEPPLASRLSRASVHVHPKDHKVSTLNEIHDGLTTLLIDLHAHIEVQTSPGAKAIDQQIWRYLLSSAGERMPPLPNFEPPLEE